MPQPGLRSREETQGKSNSAISESATIRPELNPPSIADCDTSESVTIGQLPTAPFG